jgi:hypothetical protein
MGFSGYGLLKVLRCSFDPFEGPQVGMGVDRLGFCRRPEKLGDLGMAFLLGFLGKARYFRLAWDSPAKAARRSFSVSLMIFSFPS